MAQSFPDMLETVQKASKDLSGVLQLISDINEEIANIECEVEATDPDLHAMQDYLDSIKCIIKDIFHYPIERPSQYSVKDVTRLVDIVQVLDYVWIWCEHGDPCKAVFYRDQHVQCNTDREIAIRLRPYDGCQLIFMKKIFIPWGG